MMIVGNDIELKLKCVRTLIIYASFGFACISSSEKFDDNSCIISTKSIVNPCNRVTSMWHERLGHPNHHVLQLVLQHCKIPTSSKSLNDFFSACAVGKSHRLPSSESVYTSLDLVYSNLWGPSHVSSTNGFLYYITFVGAYSRFTWIYLLKSKSKILIIFQKFKGMAELQFNFKIKSPN